MEIVDIVHLAWTDIGKRSQKTDSEAELQSFREWSNVKGAGFLPGIASL